MPISSIQFGRLYKKDKRDNSFLIQAAKKLSGEKYWSEGRWRGDQTTTPQCVGYAFAHLLSSSPHSQWLNPTGIYDTAQRIDEWADMPHDGTSVRAGAKVLHSLGFIQSYKWGFSLKPLISALLNTGPVVVGTNWYEGMFTPDSKGYIEPTGMLEGGHAYLVSGVSTTKKRFRCLQSWSRDWGKKGHFYLSFDAMEQLIKEDGEICLAIERKNAPQ